MEINEDKGQMYCTRCTKLLPLAPTGGDLKVGI